MNTIIGGSMESVMAEERMPNFQEAASSLRNVIPIDRVCAAGMVRHGLLVTQGLIHTIV